MALIVIIYIRRGQNCSLVPMGFFSADILGIEHGFRYYIGQISGVC